MRLPALLPLLLLAPLLPAHAAPAAVSGVSFTHNDWTLACDNTRTCRAAGYQRDDGDSAAGQGTALTHSLGHGGNGWVFSNQGGGWEYPAFLVVAAVVQVLLGDGAAALKPVGYKKG